MMTNHLVNGTTQVHTMPMVTQSVEQPQHQQQQQQQQPTPQQQDITTSQIVVTALDRNQQTDTNIQTINIPISNEDPLKSTPKKNDILQTEEAPTPMDTSGIILII